MRGLEGGEASKEDRTMWVRCDKVGEVSVRGRRSRCGGEKGGVNVSEVCEDMCMDKGGE